MTDHIPSKDVVRWRHRPEHGDIIRSAWGDFVRYDDIKHLLPTDETDERPDVNDVFRAGVTQAKYRFHYKEALQRMLDGKGSLSAAACLDIAREALATSPEYGDELKANACQCDPNPSIGGSPPCPVHDVRSEG